MLVLQSTSGESATKKSEDHMAIATSTIAREKALAWIARQLRWERTLAALRVGPEPTVLSKAA